MTVASLFGVDRGTARDRTGKQSQQTLSEVGSILYRIPRVGWVRAIQRPGFHPMALSRSATLVDGPILPGVTTPIGLTASFCSHISY